MRAASRASASISAWSERSGGAGGGGGAGVHRGPPGRGIVRRALGEGAGGGRAGRDGVDGVGVGRGGGGAVEGAVLARAAGGAGVVARHLPDHLVRVGARDPAVIGPL